MRPARPRSSPRRVRRALVGGALLCGALAGGLGGASPAAAAPQPFFSAVEGALAVKGTPSEFGAVTIAGTYDDETGAISARATFPPTTLIREEPIAGFDAEVDLQVSQPEMGVGSVTDGDVVLDAEFQIVVEAVTLVNKADGSRTPLPLGPEPDSCLFGPIVVDLAGTATSATEGAPLEISVSDPDFVIPPPDEPATDCGPLGGTLIPNVAGPNEGEDPNSAELSFSLSTSQGIVQELYRVVLGRAAEPDGLAYWSAALESGTTPARIAMSIARSTEGWRNAVIDSYQLGLDRAAEPAGLQYWTETMRRAQDQPYLVSYLMASPEGDAIAREAFPELTGTEAYMSHLYVTLLGRDATAADLEFWVDRIESAPNQNVSRRTVAAELYRSVEIVTTMVRDVSTEVCGTAATGDAQATLANAFVASNYQTRVLRAVATVTPCA